MLFLPGEDLSLFKDLDVEFRMGNVLDPISLERGFQGADFVIHLAGIISILPGSKDSLMHRVNVDGARNVAEAALSTGVKRLVHVGSVHIFQRLTDGEVISEETPLVEGEGDTYDHTKAAGARAVQAVIKKGLDGVIVCPSGVIGPGQVSELGNVMSSFVKRRHPVIVEGAYDFVDVRDVVDGIIRARDYGRTGASYILSGSRMTVEEVFQNFLSILGISGKAIVLPYRYARHIARATESFFRSFRRVTPSLTTYSLKTLIDNSTFSREKAEKELGYHPRPFSSTISDIIDHVRSTIRKQRGKSTT